MLVNFIFSTAEASPAQEKKVNEIFKKPLIVGASVSGDYQTASPGKRLALRYTRERDIRVIAQNGKPGKEVLKTVSDEHLKDRSAIIGIDLFFWDSFQNSPKESLDAMEKLFTKSKAHSLPLVLGEIPELMPQYQKSGAALNKRMRQLCSVHSLCKILPMGEILTKTLTDGHLMHRGIRYEIEALLPDGLHLATPASEYLADQILKLFEP